MQSTDLGLTHIALAVRDLERSILFYRRYAGMTVIHQRPDRSGEGAVAWLTDFTRPFVIVLVNSPGTNDTPLGPFGHLGVACRSREEVDRLAAQAAQEGILTDAPTDSGPPVGYWACLRDPDGNTLEIAFGQTVAFTIEQARSLAEAGAA